MTEQPDYYAWRPSLRAPHVAHAAINGQTRRTSAGCQLRWVWAMCAEHVDPEGVEQPGSTRCRECLDCLSRVATSQ
jgi:hypothetical protein